VTLVLTGSRLDRAHDAEAREGRRLLGPKLSSRWLFNWKTRGDGLRFRLDNPRNLFEWFRRGQSGKDLVIRRDREAHHIQIAGDTGTGKSTLVRQVIYQIEERGEAAIIFDPDREYIQEFFSEQRGDWVLNPKDDRCPSTGPSARKRMMRQKLRRSPLACSRMTHAAAIFPFPYPGHLHLLVGYLQTHGE
jgi:Type IV secretion-system coupling protein DNA-binding domain